MTENKGGVKGTRYFSLKESYEGKNESKSLPISCSRGFGDLIREYTIIRVAIIGFTFWVHFHLLMAVFLAVQLQMTFT